MRAAGTPAAADVPKALQLLGGEALVTHSVRAVVAGGVAGVVVVVGAGLEDEFAAAIGRVPVPVKLVAGGAERQDSVRNGLAAVAAEPAWAGAAVVLVHDAARPLVPPDVVAAVIAAITDGAAAAVPVIPVVDTTRQVTDDGSHIIDRSRLRSVQTPQGFALATLREAHERAAAAGLQVTDDAAVCEALGYEIALVPGSRAALKITEPIDLVLAEAILQAGRL